MKTFTEFKEYLQEKKAKGKSEYKKSELDDQINQAIEDAKSDGNTEDLNKLEAIRTEKDPDVKKSRFDVFMRQKDEDNSQDDAQDDPDVDSVQEASTLPSLLTTNQQKLVQQLRSRLPRKGDRINQDHPSFPKIRDDIDKEIMEYEKQNPGASRKQLQIMSRMAQGF